MPHRSPQRRQARGLERRELILRATLAVIGRGGISAVTHRAVAEEAGIPFASITYYFASKQDLLRDALVLFVDEEVARLRELGESLEGRRLGAEALADAFAAVLEADDSGTLQQFEIYLEAARDAGLHETAARCFEAYDGVARQALAAAGVRDPEPYLAAFVAMADGLALRRMGAPESVAPGALRDAFLVLFRGAAA